MKNKLLTLAFLLFSFLANAQTNPVSITLQMIPPYSNKLSDYANTPGKVVAILRNSSNFARTIYLRANITGENGIAILTDPNYKPAVGINLQANNIPYTLNISDLQDVFNINQFVTRGVSVQEIERQGGLPEGTYTFCLKAFDFLRPTFALSADEPLGCTTIRLTQLEPPILIKPFEDEEVRVLQPQNVVFSWTIPAGVPPGTQYQLKIIELFDSKRNPNDVFLASTQPPFFEKTITGNVYVFGPADPALVAGRKYAWAVTALDRISTARGAVRGEGSAYRNGGRSEIRAFIYKENDFRKIETPVPVVIAKPKTRETPKQPPVKVLAITPKLDIANINNLMTTVKGRLLYAYPEDYSMDVVNNPNQPHSKLSESNFKQMYLPKNSFQRSETKGIQKFDLGSYYSDSYLNISPKSKPIKHTKVSLVMVYATKAKDFNAIMPYYVLGNWRILTQTPNTDYLNYTLDGQPLKEENLSKILATGYTNDNGDFTFSYIQKDTCQGAKFNISGKGKTDGSTASSSTVFRTCILVVESPYYCSPVMFISPNPGDAVVLPDQVSLVKSFELIMRTVSDEKIKEAVKSNNTEETIMAASKIENINVELFRMKPAANDLPSEEGQNLPPSSIQALQMGEFSNVYPIAEVERVVAVGKSDGNGILSVNRLTGAANNDAFVAHSYTSAKTGVYNMHDGLKKIYGNSENGLGGGDFGGKFDKFLVFNPNYDYEKINANLIMKAKSPRILGKTVESTKGLANTTTFLLRKDVEAMKTPFQNADLLFSLWGAKAKGFGITATKQTDKDGYFDYQFLPADDYMMLFYKDGYQVKSYKNDLQPFSLNKGDLLQIGEIQMKTKGQIQLCVRDEDGNGVFSDIQVDDGASYPSTYKEGLLNGCTYFMPAPSGNNRTLKISPRSEEYFEQEYKIDVKEGGVTTIPDNKSIVYRRKHRIKFIVQGRKANSTETTLLPDAKIEIKSQGISIITNAKAEANLAFESPGTSFLVKITPPAGTNWSHWEEEISIPVQKTTITYTINLAQAREVLATVLSEKDQKPLKGAKVYIKSLDKFWNNQNANFAECTTSENGTCLLQGIPIEGNPKVEVFASKNNVDGITYLGDKKEITWQNGQLQAKIELKLKVQEGFVVKNIWGFPANIEEAKPLGNDAFEVSGSLINLPENIDFGVTDPNTRLDFKSVKFVKIQDGDNTFQPEGKVLPTQQISIPIKICSKLQGKANGYTQADGNKNMKIFLEKSDGKGEIRTPVVVELSSFEGAYQLSGKMELSDAPNTSKATVFKAISKQKVQNQGDNPVGGLSISVHKKYTIGQMLAANSIGLVKNLNYKVHNFNAESVASKSYLYSDSVKLFTILHTNIPDMAPADLALEAGYVTILPDKIVPFSGGNNISFSLEKWKVTGQKVGNNQAWQYDNNNGGIVIPKATVNTGVLSVGLQNLIIKPDKLIADKLELDKNDSNSLSLGGIVPLEITPQASFKFGFDPNCYHDGKPHWKLSLLAGSGQEIAAQISNLDGLEDGQKIEFGSMNLFSDNQQQLNGANQKNLVFRKVLNFSLNTIDVGADNFTMVGQANMNIPNMSNSGNGISAQILYTKGAGGKAVFNLKPLSFGIEGKGQVSFKPNISQNDQQLTSGKYFAKGKLTIADAPSGKSFVIDGNLVHQKTGNTFNTYIEVAENQKFPLDTKYLEIKNGIANSGMKVLNNEWENLRMKTVLPIGANGFEMLNDNENLRFLTLVVKGAIETDPSSGMIGLKGMDTGVGSISLFYDFPRGELRGNFFFLPPVPINFGLVNLTSSNISMAIGKNGFFMMNNGTGDLALPGGVPLPVSAGLNLVVGYYTTALPQEDQNTLINLSVKKSLPSFFQSGIKGMYSSVNLNSTPFDEGFDYGIADVATASCYARAGAAYEYRNYLIFNSLTNFTIASGNYAYAHFDVGGEAKILGCGVDGAASINFQAAVDQSISPQIGFNMASIKSTLGSLTLVGCASVGASFKLEACVLGECAGGTVSKDISATFGIENGSPKFNFSLSSCGNGMPAAKLNDSGY